MQSTQPHDRDDQKTHWRIVHVSVKIRTRTVDQCQNTSEENGKGGKKKWVSAMARKRRQLSSRKTTADGCSPLKLGIFQRQAS
jgi:hypothetical protein